MLTLPEKPKVIESKNNIATIEISGCYPGYGNTLANAMRRALLSSLPGAAITVIKIKDIRHEFSTIPHVLEDVIQIILNLKQVRLKVHSDTPVAMTLKISGEKEIKAGDIKVPSSIEIINKNAHIATITNKKGSLEVELWAEKGLGYAPQELMKREKLEVGTIALDAIFTPIRSVNYKVEDMRVGDRTDYNKLIFVIETDGTITPEEAFKYAAKTLVDHFRVLTDLGSSKKKEVAPPGNEPRSPRLRESEAGSESSGREEKKKEKQDPLKTKVEDLKLPLKIINILTTNKIKTIAALVKKTNDDLKVIEGLGDKGVKEVRKAVGYLGLTLKA